MQRDDAGRSRPAVPSWLATLSELAWRVIAVAAAAYIVVYVLARVRIVVLPLALALLLAGAASPPASWLESRGLPRLAAAWIVMLAALGVLVGAGWLVAVAASDGFDETGRALVRGWQDLGRWWSSTPLGSRLSLDGVLARVGEQVRENRDVLARWLVSGASTVVDLVVMAVLTVFFTFFLVKDGERLFATLVRQLAPARREGAERLGHAVWHTISRYFGGIAVIAVVNSTATAVALILIGVPLVHVIALATFFGSFVPFAGPVVAVVLGALVALSTSGIFDALLVVAAGFAIQQVEGNVLEPIVMGRVMKLHPIVVLATVTAGAVVAGVAGAFFAVPLVAAATAAYMEARRPPAEPVGTLAVP